MKRLEEKPARGSRTPDFIDRIQMSPCDREATRLYMEHAELFAERVSRAESGIRFLAMEIGHGCSALAHRVRDAFGKFAHH